MYEYINIQKISNLQKYNWGLRYETFEVVLYSIVGFFLPFMLQHPQWLIGTLVNAMLISGAMTLRGYKLIPIIVLPSLGVLSAGLLFGSFTVFLIYLVPFLSLLIIHYVVGEEILLSTLIGLILIVSGIIIQNRVRLD